MNMSEELRWLALVSIATGCFWMVYVLNRFVEVGIPTTLDNRGPLTTAKAPWAVRAKMAHTNAVENLAVFAPLTLVVHVAHAGTALTATAAMVYFYARLAHFLVYILGVPVARTLAFLTGFACQVVMALAIFGLV